MKAGAVIVAAGSSTRMAGVDKLLQPIGAKAVVRHSVEQFAAHERIGQLVVVASAANIEAVRRVLSDLPDVKLVTGGKRRRDSVLRGLDALDACDIVVVHDGARPLVTRELIDAVLDSALQTGAALCAVPVADTVKRAGPSGLVEATVPRESLWLAQTPQAFRVDLLRRAHAASDADATDDAALVERLGEPVRLVPGSRENLKITTPEDLRLAEAVLAARGYTAQ